MKDFGTFFAMGGYAAYIWPAYALGALTLITMATLTLRSLHARRREERDLATAGEVRRARQEARS